jgi:hypothetical protein
MMNVAENEIGVAIKYASEKDIILLWGSHTASSLSALMLLLQRLHSRLGSLTWEMKILLRIRC